MNTKQFHACKPFPLALVAALVLSTPLAIAQQRPDVRNMSCAEARSIVLQQGAAVLTTGQHTYDRYVASERFCPHPYETEQAFVSTRDTQSCAIGYTCENDVDEFDDPWWLLRRR